MRRPEPWTGKAWRNIPPRLAAKDRPDRVQIGRTARTGGLCGRCEAPGLLPPENGYYLLGSVANLPTPARNLPRDNHELGDN
jgi:hypothetical protein